jgi:hypothetical protein
MQKTAFILVIGLLYLAGQPAFARALDVQINRKETAPQVRQVIRITESQDGQVTTREFSTDENDSESLENAREQMELRRQEMKDELEDRFSTKRATIEAKTTQRRELLENKLEQRREAIRQRFASRSAQMSQTAQEHMSIVAKRVQELHDLAEKQTALGPEIREIARSQQENQASAAAELRKIEKRNLLLKLLLGNDEHALTQLNQLQTKNERQIVQLQTILDNTEDPAARVVIENTITSLEEQNVLISQEVEKDGQTFSLFGWAKKIWRR